MGRFIINFVVSMLACVALSAIWVVVAVIVCAVIGQTYDTATWVAVIGIGAIMWLVTNVDWSEMIMGKEKK